MKKLTYWLTEPRHLSESTYRTLIGLTFKKEGSMATRLRWKRKRRPQDLKLVIASTKKEIVGWLLYDSLSHEVMIYVAPKYRKRGIGKNLLDTLLNNFSPSSIWVHPHNNRAYMFYVMLAPLYKDRVKFRFVKYNFNIRD